VFRRVTFALALSVGLTVAAVATSGGTSSSTAQPPTGATPELATRVDIGDSMHAPVIAQAMAGTNVAGVGIYLPWSEIEPNPPGLDGTHIYRWLDSPFDNTVKGLVNAGVKIITVRVSIPPHWAVKGRVCKTTACPPSPAHYADFRDFVEAAIERYGPGGPSGANVEHWSLWNEPNKGFEWGGREAGTFKQYSNLLVQFHAAAVAASNQVSVDAGEIAAGGPNGQNSPRAWAVGFQRYSKQKGRDDDYDVVTIHAYSQRAADVAAKLRAYQRVFPGHPVAVTEFGWSVGRGNGGGGDWKCVPNPKDQATKFRQAVHKVRSEPQLATHVPWLLWFAGIDDDTTDSPHPKPPKCEANSWYAKQARKHVDTFGLFKRERNGSASALYPRPIVSDFATAAQQGPAGG
jgi:hypothetical protein